ncbi:penicillin-binding protein 2 [Psychromonas sp. 14N.309.X.WAT.B.A12]|uniref:peptidoglycan D,D-transpeptidase FtsI family protein n=1 Tax=unclassified Psychromonas TaxID=2614957 RepID=UPI0025AF8D3C|nr:penicillin-binding transpeptidase domain-containing protein [Psychromonas sp. 14N.309.X.WAT.B.A12]MDN2663672.1 penicillin-binding transpeptidase domain-containing protein [Psychromonas sp. 14N.309.X.WAT.B.A12]
MNRKRSTSRPKAGPQTRKKKVYPTYSSGRYIFVAVTISLIAVALISRLAFIQILEPEYLTNEADKRSLRVTSSVAHRGNIEDRNGEELAISVPAYAIWVDPKEVKKHFAFTKDEWENSVVVNPKTGLERHTKKFFYESKKWPALAEVLDIPMAELAKTLQKPRSRFAYLKRQVNDPVVQYVKQLKLSGIASQLESHRFYPTGEINANILGLTDLDAQGIEGIEKSYNDYLEGQTGKRRVRKDRLGNVIDDIEVLKEKKLAGNLQLTIDQRIQAVAYSELKRAVKMNNATSGSIVVIDIHSGEIFAMANYPSFNPNDRNQYQAYKLRNRAITDTFEPGSTVKPLVVASALIHHKTNVDEVIDTSPGWMNLGGRRVRDSHNYGKMHLGKILKKSSNIGVSKLALRLKPEELQQTFADFGLGNDTGIGLIGESVGRLPIRHRWSDFELATMSFGYGITATTLQLAKAYGILGSGGVQYPLSIIKGAKQPGEQVIPENIAREVVEMMEGVSEKGGTAPKAKVDGYRIAGKTGTSRKAEAGGYGDDYVAVFAGLAPATRPRFSIAVMINEPQGDRYYAGDVAAPVFSEVMKSTLLLTHVLPDGGDESYTYLEAK